MNFKTLLAQFIQDPSETTSELPLQPSENLNMPASKLPVFEEPTDFRSSMHWRLLRIVSEFVDGWQFLGDLKKSATIFGSARFAEDDHWYSEARKLGKLLAEAGFDVATGGGPGIMEGANRGASEAAGQEGKIGNSIGLNIQLPYEQRVNPFVRQAIGFYYFFTRKVMLAYASSAYIYFPGGFGTLDEFFEIINLIQNKRIDENITVVLVGREFWEKLLLWLEKYLYEVHGFIKEQATYSYTLVDTAEEAFAIIQKRDGKVPPRRNI